MSDSRAPIFTNLIDTNTGKHRQDLIRKIQGILGGKLITYVASPDHAVPSIMHHDAILMEDVLRSVSDSKKGYLLLNSPGGDPNAAEKLLIMCRERFTEAFHVVIPNYAKSAATLISLGSDSILMGYMAELGPIDPQIQIEPTIPGRSLPARSFIDGLEELRKKVKIEGDPAVMYLSMLAQIRPELIAICQSAIADARMTAEKWLRKYMLRKDPKQAELVADWLSNGVNYRSHGKVIDYYEARDALKLNVQRIEPSSELWSYVWELYLRSINFLQRNKVAAKLFESESVSLTMNVSVSATAAPPAPAPQPSPRPPGQAPPSQP